MTGQARILQVAHALPSDTYGGAELYTKRLAEALAAAGHEVAVAAPRGDGSEIASPVRVHQLPCVPPDPDAEPPATPVERARRLAVGDELDRALIDGPAHGLVRPDVEEAFADVLAAFEPDVVHFQHLKGLSARLPRRCRQAATVLTLHDFWTICHREQLVRADGTRCEGPTSPRKCARCHAAPFADVEADRFRDPSAWRADQLAAALASLDELVAPSRFLAERFERFAPEEADVVHRRNGIRVDRFTDTGFTPEGPLRLGYAGRITETKGLHVLLRALEHLSADVRLDVWGRFAPDEEPYHARLQDLAGEEVAFQGRYEDTATPYEAMDVLVLPSVWHENSPLVIQEAFAANVPVVTSAIGGMAELVTHGRDGLTFPVGDAEALAERLDRLARHPELVRRLRTGVRPPLSLAEHVRELEELYARIREREPVQRPARR